MLDKIVDWFLGLDPYWYDAIFNFVQECLVIAAVAAVIIMISNKVD